MQNFCKESYISHAYVVSVPIERLFQLAQFQTRIASRHNGRLSQGPLGFPTVHRQFVMSQEMQCVKAWLNRPEFRAGSLNTIERQWAERRVSESSRRGWLRATESLLSWVLSWINLITIVLECRRSAGSRIPLCRNQRRSKHLEAPITSERKHIPDYLGLLGLVELVPRPLHSP